LKIDKRLDASIYHSIQSPGKTLYQALMQVKDNSIREVVIGSRKNCGKEDRQMKSFLGKVQFKYKEFSNLFIDMEKLDRNPFT